MKKTLLQQLPAGKGEPLMLTVPIPRELVTMTAAPPDMVTQHNAPAVLGMTRGVFLELLRRPDAPPVTKLGKLRMVERVAFVGWLRSLAAAPHVNEQANDVDAVLAEFGLKQVGVAR